MIVYLSIGSNDGNRKLNIRNCLKLIENEFKIIKLSRFYRTKPYGYLYQPDFINFAIKIETHKSPFEILKIIKDIEIKLGRKRTFKWDKRIIDIDIVFYDNFIINIADLIIPHYDMHNRVFVLKPLLDLECEIIHPILKKSVKDLYFNLK